MLTENPNPGTPTLSSRLSGRFDVVGDVGVVGDTELGITSGGPTLRALRLASSVPLVNSTAVQLVYTYHARRDRTMSAEPVVRGASLALNPTRELVTPDSSSALRSGREASRTTLLARCRFRHTSNFSNSSWPIAMTSSRGSKDC